MGQLQELWEANTQTTFDEPDVDLPKHVAEIALQDGTYHDANDALAALQVTGGATREPAFKDTGAPSELSDEDAAATETPYWACAYARALHMAACCTHSVLPQMHSGGKPPQQLRRLHVDMLRCIFIVQYCSFGTSSLTCMPPPV